MRSRSFAEFFIPMLPAIPVAHPVAMVRRSAQRGFTYLGLMLLIVLIGIGLAKAGMIWQTDVQREKEKELLFVGEQYAMAIGSYYENSPPAGIRQYPTTLEDLLHDPRFLEMRRHLRKLYRDPVTGGEEWGLVKEQGRIIGVYSLALQRPLKNAGFPASWTAFASAENYSAWQFIYTPGALQVAQQAAPDGGGNSATPLPVQPGNSTSEAGEVGAAPTHPNSPASDMDIGRKQHCLGQRVSDTAACSFYCKAKGTGAECSQCQASILSRYNACLNGDSPPPLADGG